MSRLLILGNGTFAVEVLEMAESSGAFEVVGFVNSLSPPAPGTTLMGLPVHFLDAVPFDPAACRLVGGIISSARRAFIETMAARGFEFATVVHRGATVSVRATIGAGCAIGAGVVVGANARMAGHVIVNRGALVGHDVAIGEYTTLGPGANLAGGVDVGPGCFIGLGATVRERVSIAAGAVVAAGALVTKNVEAGTLVAGSPARVARRGIDGL